MYSLVVNLAYIYQSLMVFIGDVSPIRDTDNLIIGSFCVNPLWLFDGFDLDLPLEGISL